MMTFKASQLARRNLRYVKGRFECSEYFLHLVEEEQDRSSNTTDPFEFDPKSMHRDYHRAINGPVYPLGNRVEARPRMTAAKVKSKPCQFYWLCVILI